MVCVFCRRGIRENEHRYYSRQAGMKGSYHWECFVQACREANRMGAHEIENVTTTDVHHDAYSNLEPVGGK